MEYTNLEVRCVNTYIIFEHDRSIQMADVYSYSYVQYLGG